MLFINITKSPEHKLGFRVILKFVITQHSRDEELMKKLPEYFSCGKYYPHSTKDYGDFLVTQISDINEKIIPFFDTYNLHGAKVLDYLDFKKVAGMVKVGAHLTPEGLEEIRKIKSGMNRGRLF